MWSKLFTFESVLKISCPLLPHKADVEEMQLEFQMQSGNAAMALWGFVDWLPVETINCVNQESSEKGPESWPHYLLNKTPLL